LAITSIFGIVGSYIWGWLDQKLGTRKTGIIYGFWYILALALLIVERTGFITMAAIGVVGIGIGGIGNLVPSMIGTVYGRGDYLEANRFIMPLCAIVRSFAFVLMGMAVTTSGYTSTYSTFIGVCIVGIILIFFIGKSGDKPVEDEEA
ncbi:MAG: hypothetical protein LBT33_08520, partial [Spirochaetia bacterium]|nr:hypothetical protein [Spirochaetia bacterium]